MLDLNYILYFFIWLGASFFNGVTGSGGAMLALPVTALFMPDDILVPTTALLVFFISIYMVLVYGKYCHIKSLIPMVIGTLPGVLLGSYVLVYVPANIIQLSAGIILVCFILWQIIPKKTVTEKKTNTLFALVAGFFSGFLNGSIAFAGPPLVLYALFTGWDTKTTFGTLHVTTIFATIVTTGAHASAGLYSMEMVGYLAAGAPAILIGLSVAKPVVAKVDVALFTKILRFTILLAGTVCIIRALA